MVAFLFPQWRTRCVTALKAGNRTVAKRLKLQLSKPWRQDTLLQLTQARAVKAISENCKGTIHIQERALSGCPARDPSLQKRKVNTALCPYRGLLGVGLLWCWLCHLLDDGSDVCGSIQLQLRKAALICLHHALYSWHEKPHKRQINVECITRIMLVSNVNKRWALNE